LILNENEKSEIENFVNSDLPITLKNLKKYGFQKIGFDLWGTFEKIICIVE